ncbi:hypothetical protein M758_UG293400, partial [Ceratodon purpureus]
FPTGPLHPHRRFTVLVQFFLTLTIGPIWLMPARFRGKKKIRGRDGSILVCELLDMHCPTLPKNVRHLPETTFLHVAADVSAMRTMSPPSPPFTAFFSVPEDKC